ncbi:MAG: hypothetical protein MZV64_58975 [Ignavibacteriales bacterium]|nr:hypothetical protein [Ignavibacteriales bacterium]
MTTPGAFGADVSNATFGVLDHFQRLAQELHIERDQQPAAVHGRFDDGLVLAGLLGGGGDFHFARLQFALCVLDIEARHVRAFAREDLSLLASLEQGSGGNQRPRLVRARNDLIDNRGTCRRSTARRLPHPSRGRPPGRVPWVTPCRSAPHRRPPRAPVPSRPGLGQLPKQEQVRTKKEPPFGRRV